jgi:hypothetical protein
MAAKVVEGGEWEIESLAKFNRELARLRREDHNAQWLEVEREKLEFEERKYKEQVEEERRKREQAMNPPDPRSVLTPELLAQIEEAAKLL